MTRFPALIATVGLSVASAGLAQVPSKTVPHRTATPNRAHPATHATGSTGHRTRHRGAAAVSTNAGMGESTTNSGMTGATTPQ